MNSLLKEVKEYYKNTESFMMNYILYLEIVFTSLSNILEMKLNKLEPLYSGFKIYTVKSKGFILGLFLSDLARYLQNRWALIDFNKRYPLSSRLGMAYVLMIVLALNLTGFNFLLTHNPGSEISDSDISDNEINILSTVKSDQSGPEQGYEYVPELEIFQQIIRHSDLDQPLALKLASIINTESKKYDIDPYLILSVIQVESRFSPTAVSYKGARGLMQLMPATGRYVANKYDLPLKNTGSLFDPVTNIRLGVAYLSYLEDIYGNMDYALFAYNHGPKKSKNIKKTFSKSKPFYVKAVMNFKEFLETERRVAES